MPLPILLVADKNQKIYDMPNFLACGAKGDKLFCLKPEELIPLPASSELFVLPNRYPIGFNRKKNVFEEIRQYSPVSAFIPPGYTQLYTLAYKESADAELLPLFSYTPVAWYKNKYYAPAIRIDKKRVHDIRFMDMNITRRNINKIKNTKNRLIHHLINCALTYKCPNAINFFLSRYECPLPASPSCNSKCAGCISFQPTGSCSPTQHRINFTPTPEELADTALIHIKNVPNAVVSFGQGCEGEPLLVSDTINEAIEIIRKHTQKGTINMNTNGSLPNAVEMLCKSGMDSFRVSLNGVREKFYNKYYNPCGYTFHDVLESIAIAKRHKKFVSINYLTMPGFTDSADEFEELIKFLRRTKIDMIQWRNLNYDPQRYFKLLGIEHTENLLGIKSIVEKLKEIFPKIRHGYFNMPKEMW